MSSFEFIKHDKYCTYMCNTRAVFFIVKEIYVLLVGINLYFCCHQFDKEEDAEKAVGELNNRWFNGRPVHAELSPVTDFREACCRQYEMGSVFVFL